eukprot:Gb_18702 [translate_table: standard]
MQVRVESLEPNMKALISNGPLKAVAKGQLRKTGRALLVPEDELHVLRCLFYLGLLVCYGVDLITSMDKNEIIIVQILSLPQFMMEKDIGKILEATLSSGADTHIKMQALRDLYDYLVDIEEQMGIDDSSNRKKNINQPKAGCAIPIAVGAGASSIYRGIIQLHWENILERCLDMDAQVRQSAHKVVEMVLPQGLVHPITGVPHLIALEVDQQESNSKLAHHLLMHMNEKYPSFFESRLGDGLQMSFRFIQSGASSSVYALTQNKIVDFFQTDTIMLEFVGEVVCCWRNARVPPSSEKATTSSSVYRILDIFNRHHLVIDTEEGSTSFTNDTSSPHSSIHFSPISTTSGSEAKGDLSYTSGEATLSSGADTQIKMQAWRDLYDYLVDIEEQMGIDDSSNRNKNINQPKAGCAIPIAVGAGASSIYRGIIQLHWENILERCLDMDAQVRQPALKVVEIALPQGLVHPITGVPHLIALEMSFRFIQSGASSSVYALTQNKIVDFFQTDTIMLEFVGELVCCWRNARVPPSSEKATTSSSVYRILDIFTRHHLVIGLLSLTMSNLFIDAVGFHRRLMEFVSNEDTEEGSTSFTDDTSSPHSSIHFSPISTTSGSKAKGDLSYTSGGRVNS